MNLDSRCKRLSGQLPRPTKLEKYGNYECEVEEEAVMWWASVYEVPNDVLEYLEFLTYKFYDTTKVARLASTSRYFIVSSQPSAMLLF